jgi:F-type H+-transporting ATPase subunit b
VIQINITLIIQIINFLVFMFLLNALLYKPVVAKIRERETRIRKDREKAAELDQQVQEQEKRHQEELAVARQQGALEKNALTAEAKKKEAAILDKARLEAARIVEDMKASIRVEAEQVRKALDAEMAPLAQSIFEKILGRPVS